MRVVQRRGLNSSTCSRAQNASIIALSKRDPLSPSETELAVARRVNEVLLKETPKPATEVAPLLVSAYRSVHSRAHVRV